MKNINNNRWPRIVVSVILLLLVGIAGMTIYIDPYFHYHKPIPGLAYPISKERYQNDGIVRNFSYDTIITGTSMTENFKTSECDALFDAHTVKVPFNGASYREIDQNLWRAYTSDNDIKRIIRCLDYSKLVEDKDKMGEDEYPTYLTNDNWFDDVKYVLNKRIFMEATLGVLRNTKNGGSTTSFDAYANWTNGYSFGKDVVTSYYTLGDFNDSVREITQEEIQIIQDNLNQNVVALAKEHPETTFYLYFPPYSICYWEQMRQYGQLHWTMQVEQCAIETLLQCENIKLFSFTNQYEVICDLDNYRDVTHYGEHINSEILQWMSEDTGMLTKDNYQIYLDSVYDFYSDYDYSWIHQ